MNVIVNKGWTLSFESEGNETLNANDVMWHRLNVKFDDTIRPTGKEVVIAVFQDKEEEPTDVTKETLLFDGGADIWSSFIPQEVIKVAQTWFMKILVRRYAADSESYVQRGSEFVSFTVANGALLSDGSPVTLATIKSIYDTVIENAKNARESAETAKEKSNVASQSAAIATTSERNAAYSEANAKNSAAIATSKAETATAKANAASKSADIAVTSEKNVAKSAELIAGYHEEIVAYSTEIKNATDFKTVAELKSDIDTNANAINEIQADQAVQDSSISKNAADIQKLYSLARESIHFGLLKTEQAYTTRQTANGAEIFDEQYTPVKEIKGNTVKPTNVLDISKLVGDALKDNGDGTYTITKTGDGNGRMSATWVFEHPLPFEKRFYLFAEIVDKRITEGGKEIDYSKFKHIFGIKLFESSNYDSHEVENLSIYNSEYKEKAQTIKAGASIASKISSARIALSSAYDNGSYVTFKNPMLCFGELPDGYIPYFSDLKHAHINSIKSTGRNLFDLNLLSPYVIKDSKNVNYFTFKQSPFYLGTIRLFDNPKNIYVKVKYKAYDMTRPANERGVILIFIKSDGTRYELSTYLNRDGESNAYIENVVAIKPSYGSVYTNTVGECIMSFEDVPFEPYAEDVYELPQELIALYPNGIPEYDRFYPQTGELIRQTGTKIFTGDEKIECLDYGQGIKAFCIAVPNATTTIQNTEITGICNKYTAKSNVDFATANEEGVTVENGVIYFIDPNFETQIGFESYLKNAYSAKKPVIVSYKLDTPTVKKLENASKRYKGWNHGSERIIQGETDNSIYGAMPTIKNEYFAVVGLGEEETNE